MTDDLYERYKEALRVGHVAVLRGALEEASGAYRTAALIAPSRALPHTSLGGVLLRLGHLDEALIEFAAAVARAPRDEGALLGQAEALNLAGQPIDAAVALDHVSEVQEAAGRLPEASDTLRRAMELEDSAERSRRQRSLLRQIRLSAGDQVAEQLLARALRLRDEPAPGLVEPAGSPALAAPGSDPDPLPTVIPDSAPSWPPVPTASPPRYRPMDAPVINPLPDWPMAAVAGAATGSAGQFHGVLGATESDVVLAEPTAGSAEELEAAAAAHEAVIHVEAVQPAVDLAAVGVMDGRHDTPNPAVGEAGREPAGDELLGAAEAAELAGDAVALRSLLLGTARAYAREGRFEAGLDATHRLLQLAPSDVDAHLVLVDLYVARDWRVLAVEKLILLGRLADLNNDKETRARLRAVASKDFPRDERLTALRA
jgi:tetratricopeptide (TPR) repeat protein